MSQVTGRTVLEALKEIEKNSPQKLDEPLYATFGNDENGNADIIPVHALLDADESYVNGVDTDGPVVVLDDEGKESPLDLCETVIGMLEFSGVNYMMQEDYEEFQEVKAKVKAMREGQNAL